MSITSSHPAQATPTPTTPTQDSRPYPNPSSPAPLSSCLLVQRQEGGELLWGVLVETKAYSQEEPT